MDLKNQIENIIWHIENNREVSGDTIVLNDVLKALKNIEKSPQCGDSDSNTV